jgi:hemolysin III
MRDAGHFSRRPQRIGPMDDGERLNSITHVVGAALAAAGGLALVVAAARGGDVWKIVSFSIYAATLLTLYLTSALYHSARGPAKLLLRRLDHCAIYLLIAGSYTPFTLVSLRGPWGWSLFGIVWTLALVGIFQELCYAKGARVLSLLIYVVMGWVCVLGARPLIAALTWDGFLWLAAGGALYTGGIVFYVNDQRWRHSHGVWHLFVLGGSGCHFGAVALYVA